MSHLFFDAQAFNQPIETWDVSSVVSMEFMFRKAIAFNQPLSNWNTIGLNGMSNMFSAASSFNQPIGNWNTENVLYMDGVFLNASSFNQPIGDWKTDKVFNMSRMFLGATSFNQELNKWNTSNVNNMREMFNGASSFNQPLSSWNTKNLTDMQRMFRNTTEFNPSIAKWDVTSVYHMSDMFGGTGLCTDNYDSLLISWSTQPVRTTLIVDFGFSKYSSAAADARAVLVGKDWNIIDRGLGETALSKCVSISLSIGFDHSLKVFPNPANNFLTIAIDEPSKFLLLNQSGTEVLQSNNSKTIDLSEVKAGVYIYQVQTSTTTYTGRLVVE